MRNELGELNENEDHPILHSRFGHFVGWQAEDISQFTTSLFAALECTSLPLK